MLDPFLAIFAVFAALLLGRRFVRRGATVFYALLIVAAVAAQWSGSAHTWFGVGLLASSIALNAFAVHDLRRERQIGRLILGYALAQATLLFTISTDYRSMSFLLALFAVVVSRFFGGSASLSPQARAD